MIVFLLDSEPGLTQVSDILITFVSHLHLLTSHWLVDLLEKLIFLFIFLLFPDFLQQLSSAVTALRLVMLCSYEVFHQCKECLTCMSSYFGFLWMRRLFFCTQKRWQQRLSRWRDFNLSHSACCLAEGVKLWDATLYNLTITMGLFTWNELF